jgi:hypothetical protein
MVVGVLHKARIHFHLSTQNRLERLRHVVPTGDFRVAGGQLRILRNDAERLLPRKGFLAQSIPALIEFALVFVGPVLGHMVRGVRRARREVNKEGFVRGERLLLRHPRHGLVGHVLHEVIALFGRFLRLNRRRALIQGRVPLVRLAAEETVEIFEPAAAGRPCVERPDRARLPYRHLVAFAELRRRVAVELQRPRERRNRVGQDGIVPGRPGGDLSDAAHAGRMVIAPGQQGLAARRAKGGGVKAIVFQTACRQFLRTRRQARAPKRARRAEPRVVNQDDQDIRRALRRTQLLNGWEFAVRILRIVSHEAASLGSGDGQMRAMFLVFQAHDRATLP